MRSYKGKSVILAASVLTLIMLILVTAFFEESGRQSEETNTAFSATVKYVVVNETEDRIYPQIHINEAETYFMIRSSVSKQIDLDKVRNLQPGQKIYFTIENYKAQQLDKVRFADITSLRTDTQVIYSLDDYNSYFNKMAQSRRTTTYTLITLNFAVVVLTFLSMKKQRGQKPKL